MMKTRNVDEKRQLKILLLGLDFGSSNFGCVALAFSFLQILTEIAEKTHVFLDIVSVNYNTYEGWSNHYRLQSILVKYKSLSFYRKYWHAVKKCDYVFDFTGGDSFTDLYGFARFAKESVLKQVVLWQRKPMILGPQTIGPFRGSTARKWAKAICRQCQVVFARDAISYKYATQKLLCSARLTTDVAFLLPPEPDFIEWTASSKVRVGINVSGLLWNGGYHGKNDFHLKLDYQAYCRLIVDKLLQQGCEVHLIAHVIPSDNSSPENDFSAILELHEQYADTVVAPRFLSPMQAKTYMAGMDFFVGSRMHATIGAFSVGIPTVSVAYSRKFMGLYESLQYPYVIDARECQLSEAVKMTIDLYEKRDEIREQLAASRELASQRNQEFIYRVEELLQKGIQISL